MHFWVMDWPLPWLNIASLNTPALSKVAAFDLGSQPLIISPQMNDVTVNK